jgi:predicted NUDIX family phosphoesterase
VGNLDEMIVVASRGKILDKGLLAFQGIEKDPEKVKRIEENFANHWMTMRRELAEGNPLYKQPIPFCVIRRNHEIYVCQRLTASGESRLHHSLSIGFGGHMNLPEEPRIYDWQSLVLLNLEKELLEELDIRHHELTLTKVGLINDDINEVGRDHLGILMILDISEHATVHVRETDKLEGYWLPLEKLSSPEIFQNLESWSQYIVEVLNNAI